MSLLVIRFTVGVFFILARFRWFWSPEWGFFSHQHRTLLQNRLCTCGYSQSQALCFLVAFTEVFGGVALIIGLLTPLAAAGIATVMLFGFCCIWSEEVEAMHPIDHIDKWAKILYLCEPLYFVLCLALILQGAGAYSLDAVLLRWLNY